MIGVVIEKLRPFGGSGGVLTEHRFVLITSRRTEGGGVISQHRLVLLISSGCLEGGGGSVSASISVVDKLLPFKGGGGGGSTLPPAAFTGFVFVFLYTDVYGDHSYGCRHTGT